MASQTASDVLGKVNHIAFSYSSANSDGSALELVYNLYSSWKTDPGPVEVFHFTEGIMNTVRCPEKLRICS